MQQSLIKLYPNPATSTVRLSIDKQNSTQAKTKGEKSDVEATINEVRIYDSFGSIKFYRKYNKQQTATLDIPNLKKGVYIVEVNTGSGLEYQQLIIQK